MTARELRKRLKALGYETASSAADALALDSSTVRKMWRGLIPVSDRTARTLRDLEQLQPARITRPMARVLLTAQSAEPGEPVTEPLPRSRFEVSMRWDRVFREMCEAELLTLWGEQYVLTELGARCATFVQQQQAPAR